MASDSASSRLANYGKLVANAPDGLSFYIRPSGHFPQIEDVVLSVHAGSERAIRLYEQFGFRYSG